MENYLETKDHFLTGENFNLVYNPNIDILETIPQPQNLVPYYESPDYISHTDKTQSIIDHIYAMVKKYTIRQKTKLIRNLKTESTTILDIGAGTGEFLKAMSLLNWNTQGVEPNPNARTISLDKNLNIKANLSDITATFDVITLWHVLEHLPNLNQQIANITQLLNDKGCLIIAVPNYKSYDAQKYKTFWAAYDVPRHLWHFSKKSIPLIFQPYGYTLIDTLPMPFDAFYVSLLSEKYQHGKTNYFNAFLTGMRSNLKAHTTGEYSSLIYVLKKA